MDLKLSQTLRQLRILPSPGSSAISGKNCTFLAFNPLWAPFNAGGGGFHPPFGNSENWYVEYSICTYATIRFFRRKKIQFWPFSDVKTKIFIFEYFPKIPSEMNYHPFLPYFDTQHSICEIFILLFVCRGSQKS